MIEHTKRNTLEGEHVESFTFGMLVRALRGKQPYSASQFAAAHHMLPSQLILIESDRRPPPEDLGEFLSTSAALLNLDQDSVELLRTKAKEYKPLPVAPAIEELEHKIEKLVQDNAEMRQYLLSKIDDQNWKDVGNMIAAKSNDILTKSKSKMDPDDIVFLTKKLVETTKLNTEFQAEFTQVTGVCGKENCKRSHDRLSDAQMATKLGKTVKHLVAMAAEMPIQSETLGR